MVDLRWFIDSKDGITKLLRRSLGKSEIEPTFALKECVIKLLVRFQGKRKIQANSCPEGGCYEIARVLPRKIQILRKLSELLPRKGLRNLHRIS
jgi:hypothetical protein